MAKTNKPEGWGLSSRRPQKGRTWSANPSVQDIAHDEEPKQAQSAQNVQPKEPVQAPVAQSAQPKEPVQASVTQTVQPKEREQAPVTQTVQPKEREQAQAAQSAEPKEPVQAQAAQSAEPKEPEKISAKAMAKPAPVKPKKKGGKAFVIVIIILLIANLALVGWILMRDKWSELIPEVTATPTEAPTPTQAPTATPEPTPTPTPTPTPDGTVHVENSEIVKLKESETYTIKGIYYTLNMIPAADYDFRSFNVMQNGKNKTITTTYDAIYAFVDKNSNLFFLGITHYTDFTDGDSTYIDELNVYSSDGENYGGINLLQFYIKKSAKLKYTGEKIIFECSIRFLKKLDFNVQISIKESSGGYTVSYKGVFDLGKKAYDIEALKDFVMLDEWDGSAILQVHKGDVFTVEKFDFTDEMSDIKVYIRSKADNKVYSFYACRYNGELGVYVEDDNDPYAWDVGSKLFKLK